MKEVFQAGGMASFLDTVDEVGEVRTEHYGEEVRCLLWSSFKCHFTCRLPLTVIKLGYLPLTIF